MKNMHQHPYHFNSKSINAWFSSGVDSQLYCNRLNSILFIDVSLIAVPCREFSFILINAFDTTEFVSVCVCICCYRVEATQFILCKNHDLYFTIYSRCHVWNTKITFPSPKTVESLRMYYYSTYLSLSHSFNITLVPIFFLVVHTKIDT